MTQRIFFVFAFLLTSLFIFAQKKPTESFKITYKQYSNDQYQDGRDLELIYSNSIAYLSKNEDQIRQFIDYKNKIIVNIMKTDDKMYKTVTPLNKLDEGIPVKDTIESVMGFDCNLIVFNSFSNKIEVWYTDEAPAKGSPYKSYLPVKNGLVLKIVINGNRTIIADTAFTIEQSQVPEYPLKSALEISEAEFEELKITSRYTTVGVFTNERINYDTELEKPQFSDEDNGKTYRLSNGAVILKKVKLPEKDRAYCYARLTVNSEGDAYDRTGTVFMIPAGSFDNTMLKGLFEGPSKLPIFTDNQQQEYQGNIRTSNYEPQIELMRFFTSFGAGYFNNLREINNYQWAETVTYKQEVTNLIPTNKDEVWIGVFIGNYDKGGHIVSLELDFYPEFDVESKAENFVLPLFNTVNILEMSGQNYGRFFRTDTLMVEFDIPENLNNPQLVYTSTGHGGWENGDEFVPKINQIFIDGKPIYSFVPWRTDCATYRLSNPASGNFNNGLSSSDFSRSNWCPGTLTCPEFIPLSNLNPGKHTMQIVIDQGEDEGSSFSHWAVSGVITGEIEILK